MLSQAHHSPDTPRAAVLSTVEVKKAKSANSAKLPVTVPSCLPPIAAWGASENIVHSLYAQDIELAIKRVTRGES